MRTLRGFLTGLGAMRRLGAAMVLVLAVAPISDVRADAADAKRLLKAMSDYLASQDVIAFQYDATLEVVTEEGQVLGLASSGAATLERPNKLRATRSAGFADVEFLFDGTTLTLFGKNANVYTQVEAPGSIDALIDLLRDKYGRPLPAADLLTSNPYDELMDGVTNVKDLGSGVVGGVECDSLAFRNDEVDWQIWIAHGDRPYPCRYVITTKKMAGSPQYSIQVRDWKTGTEVAAPSFQFENTTDAKKVAVKDFRKAESDLPQNFTLGGKK